MSTIDDIENSYEQPTYLAQFQSALAGEQQQDTQQQQSQGGAAAPGSPSQEPDNIRSLVRQYLDSTCDIVQDDVVSVREDCHERYQWLRKYGGVGVVGRVVEPLQMAQEWGIQFPAGSVSNTGFAVVEFNLLTADKTFEAMYAEEEDEEADAGAAPAAASSSRGKPKPKLLTAIDKMGIPSAVVHVALPTDQLVVRDRAISALDTVIHLPSLSLGTVGGFSLRLSVMPIEFPEPLARIMSQIDKTAAAAAAAAANNNSGNSGGGKGGKKGSTSASAAAAAPHVSRNADLFEVPPRMHPLLQRNVRDLHCTDLLPANPYRHTVAVVHKETLRVGFVDEVNTAAIIMLDNGSIALVSRVRDVEADLLPPVSASAHGRHSMRKKHRRSAGAGSAAASAALREMSAEARAARAAERGGDVDDEEEDLEDEEEEDVDEEEEFDDDDHDGTDSLDALLERNDDGGDDGIDRSATAIVDSEEAGNEIIQIAMAMTIRDRNRAALASGSTTAEEQRAKTFEQMLQASQARPDIADRLLNIDYAMLGLADNSNEDEDVERFDEELGPEVDAALPNWAFSRPALGWFRRVRLPHKMVKKGRAIMVMGQPDYAAAEAAAAAEEEARVHYNKAGGGKAKGRNSKKKTNHAFDMGVVICMSPESVAVRWCVPHFDVNTEPPVAELDPEVNVRDLFIVQHFYPELMGADAAQDVAFVRPGREEREALREKALRDYSALERERIDEILKREAAWRGAEQQQAAAPAAAGEGGDKSKSTSAVPATAEPPLLYNVQEVETATGELNCLELNAFYSQFVFPQSVDEAVAELVRMNDAASGAGGRHRNNARGGRPRFGRHQQQQQHDHRHLSERDSADAIAAANSGTGATLLALEPWRNFFGNLGDVLKRVVRIVDVESFHCVTLIDGTKQELVPSFQMQRPTDSAQAASPLDHLPVFPRDIVFHTAEHISAEAVQQQQLAENAASTALPAVTLMKDEGGNTSNTAAASSPSSSATGGGGGGSSKKGAAAQHRVRFHKLESCALFDLQRCAHPDIDCCVSDIVTLRTRDEQAQILSLTGLPQRTVGVVRSVNSAHMTAQVAWGTWEDQEEEEASKKDGGSGNLSRGAALLAQADRFPRVSLATARAELDPTDKFAATFDARRSPFAVSGNGAMASFMIGQIVGRVSLTEVIVKWWNGATERISTERLHVHHFPYDEDYEDMDEEEFEEEEEEEAGGGGGVFSAALNAITGQAAAVRDAASNPFEDDADAAPATAAAGATNAAAATTPAAASTTSSNMKRIPSDVERGDQAALEKFLNEVHTPNSPQSPEKDLPSSSSAATAAAVAAPASAPAAPASSLLGSVLNAGRSVGSFFSSILSSPLTSQQQQPSQHQDPAAGLDSSKTPAAAVAAPVSPVAAATTSPAAAAAAAAGAAPAAASSASSPTTASPSSGGSVPATSVPGTFVACSRFSAHLVDDSTIPFAPAQPNIFMKRVMNELKHLRGTAAQAADIFVKSNEDRLHSFKFAIAGGVHTPYYQGFYCFDMSLPPTFPNAPPVVKFHSRNMRLNPNLYEDGKVCLSLLGTWSGHQAGESWAVTSTLRQVMLSIQALILCQEPFYNEPGDEGLAGTREGATHSRMYNEKVFLFKIAHLMHQAQQQPADWFGEFRAHYLRVVPRMLQRYRRYLQQEVVVGAAAESPSSPSASSSSVPRAGSINADGLILPLSTGLKTALANRVEQLQAQYSTLSARWQKELEEMHAGFGEEENE